MYKWSPYYSRYRSKWSPYYRHNSYRWSPYYNRYNTYLWSPLYSRYRWSPRYYRYLTDRYYNYRYTPLYRKYYFDDTYLDLKNKMDMFKSFLDSMPKNRSEMVNHLDLPDDALKNRTYTHVGDDLSSLGSVASSVCTLDDLKPRPKSPLSTDSSISLSRALTASEIDYEMFRRYRNRRRSEPFRELDEAIKAFPDEYLVSANRMERYFEDECRVFGPDDPGLLDLMDAIDAIDLKTLDTDLL